jgi:hypothetical protein
VPPAAAAPHFRSESSSERGGTDQSDGTYFVADVEAETLSQSGQIADDSPRR